MDTRFKRYWWAALDYDFTPDGFCDDETYGRLPALPEHLLTGDFAWLTDQAAGADADYMEPGPIMKSTLDSIDRRLARDGLALPAEFVTFMGDPELRRRIPSGSCNAWELSGLAPSPVEEHGFLLRFMHDQQGCFFFYLYLAADGSSPVLGSIDALTPEAGEEWGDDLSLMPAVFLETATWMAPDFEHFLYRHWVDNVIAHHVVERKRPVSELADPAREYVRLLQTPDRPALDSWPAPLPSSSDSADQGKLW